MSAETTPELRAVVALLDDENPTVADAAADRLRQAARVTPAQVDAAVEGGLPRQRVIGRQLLQRHRQAQLLQRVAQLGDRLDDVHDRAALEEGAIRLSRWRYPGVTPEHVRGQLDALAEAIAARMPAGEAGGRRRWQVIREVVFEDRGFDGNRAAYYSPDNSYLSRVLATRKGIPIALSTLMLALAERLELDLVGVGMPFHFLVKLHDEPGVLFDPFNRGRLLTIDDCAEFCRSYGQDFQDSYLAAVTPAQILARTCMNLVGIYAQTGESARARALIEVAARLDPRNRR